MRSLHQTILPVIALAGLTTALEITSPTGNSVNISEPITIAWSEPGPPNDNFVTITVESHFEMDKPDDPESRIVATDTIAANLSITGAGSVEWSADRVAGILADYTDNPDEQRSGRIMFTVFMVGRTWREGSIAEHTHEFELTGYEGAPESAGALWTPAWPVLLAIGAAAQAWLL